jgi:small subunit ribosomal protein S18
MIKQDFFTKFNLKPSYKDIENLKKFLTPRLKIMSRQYSGLSAKTQRELSKQIKYARFLALLPFIPYNNVPNASEDRGER